MAIFAIRRVISGAEYRDFVIQQIGTKLYKKSMSPWPSHCGLALEVNDQSEPLNLASDDEKKVADWVEGLHCLLDSKSAFQLSSIKAEVC